ncbi:cytochrome c biogenesis CcdA family protein [Georgenia sp. SUBG003]|uniref:cytochrome c biogenesis CcdA family protein n=1 Tax=Georgenia sp. SUBG003 TaxID=1497974 RepID=UPI0006938143
MGGELLAGGSVLAAFFAGGVALFAPCCIVFLAPSYLAGAVKNRRWRLLPLTCVFTAGLALVLVPITVGVSLVAGAIARYHAPLYVAGGLLMLVLAALSLSGRMWSLPSFVRAPDTARGDTASFFALGVFSGVASSCCAPVLAGVMTLSALSGSVAGGAVLGLAYVFGMVFPLFVMGLLWDTFRLDRRRRLRARPLTLRLAGRTLVTNSVNLAVAVAFTVMGIFVMALSGSPDMTGGTAAQEAVGTWLAEVFAGVQNWLAPVPEPVLGAGLLGLAAIFVVAALRDRRTPVTRTTQEDGAGGAEPSCHDTHAPEGLHR